MGSAGSHPVAAVVIAFALATILTKILFFPSTNETGIWHKPNDPLMLEATEKARISLGRFRELFAAPNAVSGVKIKLERPDGAPVEIGWADVKSVKDSSDGVLFELGYIEANDENEALDECSYKPPQFVSPTEIYDWIINLEGRIYGAYTEKAMIAIAKRDGIKIPKYVLKRAINFVD